MIWEVLNYLPRSSFWTRPAGLCFYYAESVTRRLNLSLACDCSPYVLSTRRVTRRDFHVH
jgi:hypothetical protein